MKLAYHLCERIFFLFVWKWSLIQRTLENFTSPPVLLTQVYQCSWIFKFPIATVLVGISEIKHILNKHDKLALTFVFKGCRKTANYQFDCKWNDANIGWVNTLASGWHDMACELACSVKWTYGTQKLLFPPRKQQRKRQLSQYWRHTP